MVLDEVKVITLSSYTQKTPVYISYTSLSRTQLIFSLERGSRKTVPTTPFVWVVLRLPPQFTSSTLSSHSYSPYRLDGLLLIITSIPADTMISVTPNTLGVFVRFYSVETRKWFRYSRVSVQYYNTVHSETKWRDVRRGRGQDLLCFPSDDTIPSNTYIWPVFEEGWLRKVLLTPGSIPFLFEIIISTKPQCIFLPINLMTIYQ